MYTKNKIYEKGRYAAILSRIPFPQKVTRKEIYFIFFYEESSGDIFQENPDQVISTRKKKKFLSQKGRIGCYRNVLCTSTTSCVSLLVLRWLSAVLDSSVFLTFANPEFLLKLINNKFIKKFAIVTIVFWKCNCKLP